ncbi:MAG: succinyl-CoA synthetase, alpha subunit [Thermoleophilia bacterium]|nr:succinyl-CoA synthetase, alpha subunit [Thermoleophilia bacterium]
MGILVSKETRLVVSGITGREGSFHALNNRKYGTNVVAGVTPGKGGQDVEGIPVYDTIKEAVDEQDANTSLLFVPPRFAVDAIYEAVDSGIRTIICITEGIPAHDMLLAYHYVKAAGATLVGPNCPGICTPGEANVGIMPAHIFTPGSVGLVSRSGTLTYQLGKELSDLGIGQSTILGIGGDPIVGTNHRDALAFFEADPDTDMIVMVGEIGGNEEELAAEYIRDHVTKPVIGYIAGLTAPEGKAMGHAGAIISGNSGTAQSKVSALEAAGVKVGKNPTAVALLVAEARGVTVPA